MGKSSVKAVSVNVKRPEVIERSPTWPRVECSLCGMFSVREQGMMWLEGRAGQSRAERGRAGQSRAERGRAGQRGAWGSFFTSLFH